MNDPRNAELAAVIEKQIRLAQNIRSAITQAMEHDVPLLGRTGNAAVLVAGLIENYYTCLETAWQKISQRFENHLESGRWHVELLDKMRIKIEGVRLPAVSEESYPALLELLKFRHFRRYYFELEYDWDRIDFLLKKLEQAHDLALADLRRFVDFLNKL
ncbi:MAG: hypothetical protein M0Z80_11750 [Treponema sp.]|nr:hypothetical protein [Treponema sp.]